MTGRIIALVCLLLVALSAAAMSAQEPAPATQPPAVVEQLRKLEADLAARQKEYEEALAEFDKLKQELETARAAHKELEKTDDAAKIAASQEALDQLEKKAMLAQERVDLAISERKAVQTLLANLQPKPESNSPPAEAIVDKSKSNGDTSMVPGMPNTPPSPATETPRPISKRVAEADSEVSEKEQAAKAAQLDVKEVRERKRALEENLEIEKKRLANAYKRYDNLAQTLQTQEDELYKQLNAGKEFKSLSELDKKRDESREQLQAVSKELQDHTARVQTLQTQLLGLHQEELAAAKEAADKAAAAEEASRARWLVVAREYVLVALPRVVIIVLMVLILRWLIRFFSKRLLPVVARAGRGTEVERENHAQTLVSVFSNAIETALYLGALLIVLQTLNVPVATLLGGVAVVGLAVAFGAQNLIRDYFTGFMILLENQYKLNDVVTINSYTGTVERITLRITVLRDFEGKVYFIPNGQITSVINITHGWSRVVLDIGVAYKERIEKVMSVLLELAEGICREPGFQDAILQEPELLGVEQLGDSAVVIRLCLITRPDKKFPIRREMLRRIKNRFDELGIEIPFPQTSIHLPTLAPGENFGGVVSINK